MAEGARVSIDEIGIPVIYRHFSGCYVVSDFQLEVHYPLSLPPRIIHDRSSLIPATKYSYDILVLIQYRLTDAALRDIRGLPDQHENLLLCAQFLLATVLMFQISTSIMERSRSSFVNVVGYEQTLDCLSIREITLPARIIGKTLPR